jgi:hypothetical protein
MLAERQIAFSFHPRSQVVGCGQRRPDCVVVTTGSAPFGQVSAGAHAHHEEPATRDHHPVGPREALERPLDFLERLVGPPGPHLRLSHKLREVTGELRVVPSLDLGQSLGGRVDLGTQQVDLGAARM